MTRGKLVLITDDKRYYISTEFNGSMYMNGGYGDEILKEFISENIQSVEDFYEYVESFNKKYFQYDNEYMYREITEESTKYCATLFIEDCRVCCRVCDSIYTCKIDYDFCGSNLFDITTYNYCSDYMYWLNISSEDIEVKAVNGIVRINSGGGAVFSYRDFVETEWDSGFINLEESYDFEDEAKAFELMDEYNLTQEEADEWVTWTYSNHKTIVAVYEDYSDVSENYLFSTGELPGYLSKYFDYEAHGEDLVNYGDNYYELNSGKIIKYDD